MGFIDYMQQVTVIPNYEFFQYRLLVILNVVHFVGHLITWLVQAVEID